MAAPDASASAPSDEVRPPSTAGEQGLPVTTVQVSPSGEPVALQPGRFTILGLHAQGGLGQVSLARDENLKRQVALKEIRADRRGQAHLQHRFLAEAEITGQLEHPGIVPIYALEQRPDGNPYYAMRFIQGQTLAEALREFHAAGSDFKSLTFRGLLQRFVAVCQTIAYAHSKGIIHRDLKPANIMLGNYGETLVLDWGLAKTVLSAECSVQSNPTETPPVHSALSAQDSGLTEAGQVLGTPAYMSPEQAGGEVVGPATDIYALGAVLHELLAGRPPYVGESAADVLNQVRKGPPPLPSSARRQAPRPLEAVSLKGMARSAGERYPSAADLAGDIERWLADEPVSAYREPWPLRAGRVLRRHRTLVASSAIALVIVAASLVLLSVLLNAKNSDLAEAHERERGARRRSETVLAEASRMLDADRQSSFKVWNQPHRENPYSASARIQFSKKLVEHQQSLAALEPENLQHRVNLAWVNVSLGIRLLEVDPQSAAGKAALDSGVRLMEELSAGEQDVRVALAGVLENQAWANGTTAEQRRRCLERVRTIREELAKAEHAGSAAVQWLALTYMNLVAAGAREPQEEVAYLGRVRELCRTLDFHNRANVRGAQVFVAATVQLADWLLPSKPAKASELYDEAIALAEQLLQRDGENEHLRDLLAMSYNGKGRSLRGADAIPWFQKTCAVRERLLLDQRRTLSAPDMTRRVLLQGYHNLALEQIRALRTLEAAHTCERIIQVGEDLVPVWPQDSTIKYVIGVASWHLGAIRSPFGFSPERLALTTKAIKYLSEAVEAVPRDAPARSELCWMLEELAAHEARDGKRDAALERYSRTAGHLRELRAQKAASPKDVERFKSVLRAIVRIQRELGQSSDAAASELRELEPSKPAGDLKP